MIDPFHTDEEQAAFTLEGVLEYIEAAATSRGWAVNQNTEARDVVVTGLMKNWEEHGAPYCPCILVRADDSICPCDDAGVLIDAHGACHCGLFLRP